LQIFNVKSRVPNEAVSQGVHKVVVETLIAQRIADSLEDLMLRTPTTLALFSTQLSFTTR